MVVQRQVQQASRGGQLLRDRPIFRRRGRVAARVIVHDDDTRRGLRDRGAEHLSRMHQGTVEQPASDQDLAQDLALTVQREEVKLLDLQVAQPATKQAGDIVRFPDSHRRRPLFAREPGTQLEGGEQPGRLGGPDARGLQQLAPWPGSQPPKRAVTDVQQPPGNLEDAGRGAARSYQDGNKFGGRQRGGPEGPEPLAWAITRWQGGWRGKHRPTITPRPGRAGANMLLWRNNLRLT